MTLICWPNNKNPKAIEIKRIGSFLNKEKKYVPEYYDGDVIIMKPGQQYLLTMYENFLEIRKYKI